MQPADGRRLRIREIVGNLSYLISNCDELPYSFLASNHFLWYYDQLNQIHTIPEMSFAGGTIILLLAHPDFFCLLLYDAVQYAREDFN